MKDIVIIGAGGFGREVAMLIEDINKESPTWNIKGFVDENPDLLGEIVYGFKVLGDMNWLVSEKLYVVNAIGNGKVRYLLNRKIEESENKFATLLHPSALLSTSVSIGEGSIICAGSIITTDISIGKHVIINLTSTIGHDAILKDYVTVLPASNISGYVTLNKFVTIGTGSQIIQGVTLGENTILGAGATVIKDLPENCTAVGSPAKPIKFHE